MLFFLLVFCLLASIVSIYIGKEQVFYLGDGIIHSSAMFILAGSFFANSSASFVLMLAYCLFTSGFLMLIKNNEDKTASLCLFAYFSLVVSSFITQFTSKINVHELIEGYFLGSGEYSALICGVMFAIFAMLFAVMFVDNILEKPSKAKLLHSAPVVFATNFLISFAILIMAKQLGFLITSCFIVAPFVFARFFTSCNKRSFLLGTLLTTSSALIGYWICMIYNLVLNITICFVMFMVFSFGFLIKASTLVGCRECKTPPVSKN